MGLVCPGPNPFMKGAGVQVHQRRASCVKGVALEDNSPRISHEGRIYTHGWCIFDHEPDRGEMRDPRQTPGIL